jgi:hypothetical protein
VAGGPGSSRPSAVCSLWHCPASHLDWPLASTLPCGVPTFLDRVDCPAATTQPTHRHGQCATSAIFPTGHRSEAMAGVEHEVEHGAPGDGNTPGGGGGNLAPTPTGWWPSPTRSLPPPPPTGESFSTVLPAADGVAYRGCCSLPARSTPGRCPPRQPRCRGDRSCSSAIGAVGGFAQRLRNRHRPTPEPPGRPRPSTGDVSRPP